MPFAITVRPERLMPVKTGYGRIEYVSMTDTYSIVMEGLTADEVREKLDQMRIEVEQLNTTRDAPELPREFSRRLDID